MTRWANQRTEFHQIILPDGSVIELGQNSKTGRWLLSSQGWGLPAINWQTTQGPYQHGQTVTDYRLQPRTVQLLLSQSTCSRDEFWEARESLINAVQPNQGSYTFEDYWIQRSQADTIQAHDSISSLCEWNGRLYGLTGSAHLLVWDDVGAWQIAAEPPSNAIISMAEGMSLCAGDLELLDFANMTVAATHPLPDDWVEGSHGTLLPTATNWFAGAFKVDSEITCGGIRIYYYALLFGNYTVNVEIRADTGGHLPTGLPLASGTATITESGWGWLEVTLSPLALNAGVFYNIVVSSDAAPGNFKWAYTAGDLDVNTWYAESLDSGATWITGFATGFDPVFEVLAVENVTKNLLWATGRGNKSGPSTSLAWAFDGVWSDYYWAHDTTDTRGYCSIIFDGELYVGGGQDFGATGELRQYNRAETGNHYFAQAGVSTEMCIQSLEIYEWSGDPSLFCGTMGQAELWRFTGLGIFLLAAQAGGDQLIIFDLQVYQGQLYGISNAGKLWMFDVGLGVWVLKAGALVDASPPNRWSLVVYKGRLYAAGKFGDLYVWDNVSAWELICSIIIVGAAQGVICMTTYRNRMFAGTSESSCLIEYRHERVEDPIQPLILRRHLSNGEDRDLEVVISEGPQFDDTAEGWREWSYKELLRLTAYNPVMYDPVMLTTDWTMGVGFIDETQAIAYTGDWEEHPVITIEGPLSGLTVINETLDCMFALDYDIPDGVTVTIDCAKMTITDSLHNNLISALTPESNFATFRLEKIETTAVVGGGLTFPLVFPLDFGGVATFAYYNQIRVIGHDSDAGTTLSMDYYRRFIGI